MIFKFFKKGLSPIVASILLLVVAVLAVIAFQNWYSNYSSVILSTVNQQSSSISGSSGIEILSGNTLYFKNSLSKNISLISVTVNNISCNLSGNLFPGINALNLTNGCLTNLSSNTPDIIVITNVGVFYKSEYINPSGSLAISLCSGLKGGDWVEVPGNLNLGTSNFCVMKYEAKFLNYTGKINTGYNTFNWVAGSSITSTASGGPIVNITQTQAMSACQSLGSHYHLISNNEWLSIARNVANISSNWNSSIVGSGYIYSGHNDNSPAYALNSSTNDSNGYYETGNSAPSNQRRTLYLSNGQVIWDLAGNVQEWANGTVNSTIGNFGKTSYTWYQWSSIASTYHILYGPLNTTWDSSNGIGEVYTGGETAGTNYALLRGGLWFNNVDAGIFYLGLNFNSSLASNNVGFRCSYTN